MTKSELWELVKTGIAIVYVILGALAVFGPLAEWKEYIVLASTIVTGVAAVLGVTLTKPAEQVQDIKARRAAE